MVSNSDDGFFGYAEMSQILWAIAMMQGGKISIPQNIMRDANGQTGHTENSIAIEWNPETGSIEITATMQETNDKQHLSNDQ